ncbi:hypothetical protein C8J57DRAFT_1261383 [Mycena rebaudengoi]|nr:hypothetical protein C8J57DRAFT_1261383 [Mycena rebaudengoi]
MARVRQRRQKIVATTPQHGVEHGALAALSADSPYAVDTAQPEPCSSLGARSSGGLALGETEESGWADEARTRIASPAEARLIAPKVAGSADGEVKSWGALGFWGHRDRARGGQAHYNNTSLLLKGWSILILVPWIVAG